MVNIFTDYLSSTPGMACFRGADKIKCASLKAGDFFIPSQIVVYAIKNGGSDASVRVSKNGGEYQTQSTAMKPDDKTEQFILGTLAVEDGD